MSIISVIPVMHVIPMTQSGTQYAREAYRARGAYGGRDEETPGQGDGSVVEGRPKWPEGPVQDESPLPPD